MSFKRVHERPWVYGSTFVVATIALVASAVLWPEGVFLSLLALFQLCNDAVWRHRMHEIDRDTAARQAAVRAKYDADMAESQERYERRLRVLAYAQRDPGFWKTLAKEIEIRGESAIDDCVIPTGKN